jgi:hypothetical protein
MSSNASKKPAAFISGVYEANSSTLNAGTEYFSESLLPIQEAILHHVQQYRNLNNLSPCKQKLLKRVSETKEEEIVL